MPRAEALGDIAVILALLIFVAHQHTDGSTGGPALEYAGENFHAVGLAPLRHMARSAGFPAIELLLDVGFAQFQSGRATVHHATVGRTMRLTERGHAE